jgi:hypothetical protein
MLAAERVCQKQLQLALPQHQAIRLARDMDHHLFGQDLASFD